MKDLNLTSEQLNLLESLTEEQQDVFEFAVKLPNYGAKKSIGSSKIAVLFL